MSDQHKPGPATDALVAEKVMGQSCPDDLEYSGKHEAWGRWNDSGGNAFWFTRMWPSRYTTDIAAAWEVHQKMRTRIFSVRQRYYRAIQCAVRQRLNMAGQPLWPDVFGVLKPEDICLAALAVAESEADDASND